MQRTTGSSKNNVLLKHLTLLSRGYSTGNFEALFPQLSEDVKWESMWVLQPRTGKQTVISYLREKGLAMKNSGCLPQCEIVQFVGNMKPVDNVRINSNGRQEIGSLGLMYPVGKYAMLMTQRINGQTNGAIVDLTLDESDKIARIDLCSPDFYRYEKLE